MAYQIVDASGFLNTAAELKTAVGAASFSFGAGPQGVNEGRGQITSGVLAANLGLGDGAAAKTVGFWAVRPTTGANLFIGMGRQSGVAPVGARWGVVLTGAGTGFLLVDGVQVGAAFSYLSNVWQHYDCTFSGATAQVDIYDTSFNLLETRSAASASVPNLTEFGMNTASQPSGSILAHCARMVAFSDVVDAYPYEIAELAFGSDVSNTLTLVGSVTLHDAANDNSNATTAGGTGTAGKTGTVTVGDIEPSYSPATVLVGVAGAMRCASTGVVGVTLTARFGSEAPFGSVVEAVGSPFYSRRSGNVTAFTDIDAQQVVLAYSNDGGAGSNGQITDSQFYAVLKLAVEAATSVGVTEAQSDLLVAVDNVATAVAVTEALTEVQLLVEATTAVGVTEAIEVFAKLEEATTVGVAESAQVDSGGAGNKFLIIDD